MKKFIANSIDPEGDGHDELDQLREMLELEGTLFHLFKTMCTFIEADKTNKNVSIEDILAMKNEIKSCMEDIMDVLLL